MFRLRKPGEGWGGGRLKRQKAGLITSPNYISSPRPFFRAPPLLESSLRTAAPSPTPGSIICPDTSPLSPAQPHSPFPLSSSSSAGEGGSPREETGRRGQGLHGKRRLHWLRDCTSASHWPSPPGIHAPSVPRPRPSPAALPRAPRPAPRRGGTDSARVEAPAVSMAPFATEQQQRRRRRWG